MIVYCQYIYYHNSARVLFADDDCVSVHFDLNHLDNGPNLLILTLILQHDAKMFQCGFIGQDGGHLVRTSALEVVAIPIKGHKMWVTRYHTRGVVNSIATPDPVHHLALLPGGTAGPTGGQSSTSGARVAVGAVLAAPEGGSGFHVVTLVRATALSSGDALGAAEYEAVITDARLHAGGVTFCGGGWVCACGRTATSAELVLTVFWALGCSCGDKMRAIQYYMYPVMKDVFKSLNKSNNVEIQHYSIKCMYKQENVLKAVNEVLYNREHNIFRL